MIYLDENNIKWKSAETKKYCIEYIDYLGRERTYRPDFIVDGEKLVEIKPKRLQNSPLVTIKTEAATEKCKEWGLNYEIVDVEIQAEKIKKAIDAGLVKFIRDYEKRFLEYLSKTVQASC